MQQINYKMQHTVNDHDFCGGFLFTKLVEYQVYRFAKGDTVRANLFGRSKVLVRHRRTLDVEKGFRPYGFIISTGSEILQGRLDRYDVVGVNTSLYVLDACESLS
jgi:hypothetical protein